MHSINTKYFPEQAAALNAKRAARYRQEAFQKSKMLDGDRRDYDLMRRLTEIRENADLFGPPERTPIAALLLSA
jgi:hypothetical protein